MNKNVTGQKIAFFAFDATTNAAKTGDAANLTAYVDKDWGGVNALTDTSASEISSANAPGWYQFDVSQSETNADALLFTCTSVTADVSVVGQLIYTLPASFSGFVTPTGAAVNATQFAGQTITAAAGVTLPSSVASPTNITAGTITTVTNLTNAATAGDLTNTMKTSVTTAATATAMTESYSTDGATMTAAQALYLIAQRLGEFDISSTTITVKKLDGSTTAATYTLDDATDPTSSTRAS